jgi:hypothetical protein
VNGDTIFALGAYLFAPIALARIFTRAGALEILHAYLIWIAILLGLGILMGNTAGEKIGWPLIFGMFLTTPAIPTLIAILRATGLRLPWFAF